MSGLEPPLIWTFLKRKIGQLGGNGSTQRSGSVRLTLAPEQTSTCQFPSTNIFRVKNQRWWSVWVYTNLAVKASQYRAVSSTTFQSGARKRRWQNKKQLLYPETHFPVCSQNVTYRVNPRLHPSQMCQFMNPLVGTIDCTFVEWHEKKSTND